VCTVVYILLPAPVPGCVQWYIPPSCSRTRVYSGVYTSLLLPYPCVHGVYTPLPLPYPGVYMVGIRLSCSRTRVYNSEG